MRKRWLAAIITLILYGGCLPVNRATAQRQEKGVQELNAGNPAMLIEAKKFSITGKQQEAEDLLKKYVAQYPKDPVGQFELAKILAGRKAYAEALTCAENAVALNDSNSWYQLFLADMYQVSADYEKALKIFEHIVAGQPDNLESYYQLAALYLATGKNKQAIQIYDEIEKRTGISEEISLQKEKIFLHLDDFSSAEQELKKLINAFPAESRYYGILAELYMSNDKKDKALEQYGKILEVDPDNAYIHITLADYYRKAGDKARAFAELKTGFANPNLDVDTKVNILLSFYTVNEIVADLKGEAFELAAILVSTHPEDAKVYSIQGDLFSQDRQYEAARNSFLKVIALDSSRFAVWEELLRMDLLIGDYQHLKKYGYRSLELFPEQPVLYLLTALAEFQLKEYLLSEKMLNKGLKLIVNNNDLLAQYYMYLGDVYHSLDSTAKSDQAYERSLQIRDDNAYVLNNYSYYLSLRSKDLDKAEQMAKKAVSLDPENSSFQDTYGWVLYKLGRFKEAEEWVGKSLEDRENASGEVIEHYGDILYKLDQQEKALDYWKKAKVKGNGSKWLNEKILQEKLLE